MVKYKLLCCLLAALLIAPPAFAQTAPPVATTPPVSAPAPAASAPAPAPAPATGFNGSFLFSPAEIAAIQQAAAGSVPGTAMLEAGKTQEPIPARRVIALSGVVYRSDDDWVAWINGKKVLPDDLLPEIVDIQVARNGSVHLKWFDIGMNKVIGITLRPHQTYDITTGVLLPQ